MVLKMGSQLTILCVCALWFPQFQSRQSANPKSMLWVPQRSRVLPSVLSLKIKPQNSKKTSELIFTEGIRLTLRYCKLFNGNTSICNSILGSTRRQWEVWDQRTDNSLVILSRNILSLNLQCIKVKFVHKPSPNNHYSEVTCLWAHTLK